MQMKINPTTANNAVPTITIHDGCVYFAGELAYGDFF